jgi:hypothetical protein
MPLRRFWWVALGLVAGLSTVGWARSNDAGERSPSAASDGGKTAQQSAQDKKIAVVEDGPDLEVKELRFDRLEARLRTMQAGAERDYFAGVLANATGHIIDSIQFLNSALPLLRASRPDRAAVALEDLADDYSKTFQYADAARADDDLLTHFLRAA